MASLRVRKSEGMGPDSEGQTTRQENKIFRKEKMKHRKWPHAGRKHPSQPGLPPINEQMNGPVYTITAL